MSRSTGRGLDRHRAEGTDPWKNLVVCSTSLEHLANCPSCRRVSASHPGDQGASTRAEVTRGSLLDHQLSALSVDQLGTELRAGPLGLSSSGTCLVENSRSDAGTLHLRCGEGLGFISGVSPR